MKASTAIAAAAATLLLAGCGSSEPTEVNLSGEWGGTVNALGIGAMTMTIVDENNELTITGEWVPEGGGAPLTVTGQGLHFGTDINLAFRFNTATGPANYTTQGQVETEDRLHLVFPSVDSPTRVDFTRR
jgi:hypothetical protein